MRLLLWLEKYEVRFFLGAAGVVGLATWWFGL